MQNLKSDMYIMEAVYSINPLYESVSKKKKIRSYYYGLQACLNPQHEEWTIAMLALAAEIIPQYPLNAEDGGYWHGLLPCKVVCEAAHQLSYTVLIWVELTPL